MSQEHLVSTGKSEVVSGCTFAVSDVVPATDPLPDMDYHAAVQARDGVLYRNPAISSPCLSPSEGPKPSEIPALPAKAPFKWRFLFRKYDMEFIGGLLGVSQDAETLCLTPEIGWAVREATPNRVSQRDSIGGVDEVFDWVARRRPSQRQA